MQNGINYRNIHTNPIKYSTAQLGFIILNFVAAFLLEILERYSTWVSKKFLCLSVEIPNTKWL